MPHFNNPQELGQFLVKAKIATYASGNDTFVVSPVLPGAHQLEYADGEFLYRDLYYGGYHFIGMETVFQGDRAIWGMSYYGGVLPRGSEEQIAGMPQVLKAALREVPLEAPFRGPQSFQQDGYEYENEIHGNIFSFHGCEIISIQGLAIYQLHYSGGVVE
jgi:hypothetical protein